MIHVLVTHNVALRILYQFYNYQKFTIIQNQIILFTDYKEEGEEGWEAYPWVHEYDMILNRTLNHKLLVNSHV